MNLAADLDGTFIVLDVTNHKYERDMTSRDRLDSGKFREGNGQAS